MDFDKIAGFLVGMFLIVAAIALSRVGFVYPDFTSSKAIGSAATVLVLFGLFFVAKSMECRPRQH